MIVPSTAVSRHAQTSLALWNDLTARYRPRDFALRLWDGTTSGPDPGQPARFTVVLEHAGALRQMFWPFNTVALGEAYIYGDFDVQGDMHAFLALLKHLIAQRWGLGEKLNFLTKMLALPSERRPRVGRQPAKLSGRRHSVDRDRQAVRYHYDLSNDFFALWLDRRMVYTCAYFQSESDDLDTAQEQKLDLICRKLRLKPGERLLDIGCGWGGLIRHAAERYGAEAVGITLSQAQRELARERIRRAGLEGHCRVEDRDYREVTDPHGFDKLVSVGMVEAVGDTMLPAYFTSAWRLLRPGGLFLNHGIARSPNHPLPRWREFSMRYVFPDGELVSVAQLLALAERAGFEVRDVENLREHYALTLEHWVRRLEARHEEAVAATDEVCYRIFRLYMAGARSGFQSGLYELHQALLVKPDAGRSGLPLTRADWYRPAAGS